MRSTLLLFSRWGPEWLREVSTRICIWACNLQKSERIANANEAVKYYASEALNELWVQKVWAKMDAEMARGKLFLWFSDILRCVKFWNTVAWSIPEWKSEVRLRSGLVAWALALRFSFTCCVAGYCLVALYDWRPRDMLCSWQHPAIMLPAGAVIWQIFGPVHCSSEAFFECSLGSVSASYVSKLLTSQCS